MPPHPRATKVASSSHRAFFATTTYLILCLAFSAVIGFSSCGPAVTRRALPPETVLFDVFSLNNAWGFSCGGCCVDVGGNVRRYDCAALRDSLLSPEWRGREKELLARRYHMKDTVVCHVKLDELATMQALIREASGAQPGEEVQTGNDMGRVAFTAYLYGPDKSDSTEVLLATAGDFSREPSSPAAETLVKWLRQTCSCQHSVNSQ